MTEVAGQVARSKARAYACVCEGELGKRITTELFLESVEAAREFASTKAKQIATDEYVIYFEKHPNGEWEMRGLIPGELHPKAQVWPEPEQKHRSTRSRRAPARAKNHLRLVKSSVSR